MIGEQAFEGMSLLMDVIERKMHSLPLHQKIDLAARMRAVKDRMERIDAGLREELLPQFQGAVFMPGNMFVVKRVVYDRATVKGEKLRDDHPDIYADYSTVGRITSLKFDARA